MFKTGFPKNWSTLRKLLILRIMQGAAAVLQTVTGNAPLTLANAIARAIKSLTQTGLCAQASTPTPSAPVDIKCNNGALMMVDDELPSGYKRVKGFSMNDNCYWKFTDFKLNGSDTLRFSFSCTTSCNVIGAYSGSASGNNYSLYVATGGGNYLRYKSGAYNSVIDTDKRYDVVITPTGTSGMKTNSTWTALEFTTSTDFCVGTTSTSTSSAKMKGSFFGDIIVDGRMHLVPCERVSDSKLGYYDLIGEAFHAPTTGTPTSLGYDGSHYALQTVGTAEVLTVGGKNLNAGTLASVGYTSTGAESTSSTFVGTLCKIPCAEGEKYTVSFGGFTTSGISGVFINTWKTDGTFNSRQAIASIGETTYTIPTGVGMVNFTLYKTGGATIDSTSWMQVERGASATPYEPYVTPQAASVVNLLSVGSYADTQEIISGAITRKCGIKVFDGTETWTLASNNDASGNKCFYTPFTDRAGGTTSLTLLCTHYAQAPAASYTTLTTGQFLYNSSTSNFNVYFDGGAITTKDGWTDWLKAQYAAGTPVIVVYPLATETTENVAGQSLSTAAGTNVVSVTAEVSPIALEAEYYKAA